MSTEFSKLSQRQQNILKFMDRYIHENGFPPTIREIGQATDIDSTSVVNYNLNKLVNAGFLERAEAKSRGMRLIREIPGGNKSKKVISMPDNIVNVQVYGRIVASEPVEVGTDVDPEDVIEVPASLIDGVNPAEVFALTVRGDSMIDAMIQDGDTVILRQAQDARDGDMVAVWLTDRSETTLKHFYKEKNRIRLQPAHPTMDAIYVDPQYCQIQGKVLSVMRRL